MIPKNFLFIGWNYLFSKQKNSTIKYMTRICFIGIFLAAFSLSFIMSIMKGFEDATYQTMQNIYPDLILDAHEDIFDYPVLKTFLEKKYTTIASVSPHALGQGLLHNSERETAPIVIQIHGINPLEETKTSNLEKTILHDETLSNAVQNNHLLIGKKAAQSLHLLPGEIVTLLYSEESDVSSMKLQETKLTIGATFETGIEEYDYSFAYCSLHLFKQLFPEEDVSQIYIKLNNVRQENAAKSHMQKDLNIDVYSWKDIYPTLLSAMKLESLGMLLILFLIVCIATINIISVLFMYIYQKQKDIALFICMGLSKQKIKYIFLFISSCITLSATVLGIVLSHVAGFLLQKYPVIEIPQNVYYSNQLPFVHDLTTDLILFISVIFMSCITSLIPLQKISRMNITLIIKNE